MNKIWCRKNTHVPDQPKLHLHMPHWLIPCLQCEFSSFLQSQPHNNSISICISDASDASASSIVTVCLWRIQWNEILSSWNLNLPLECILMYSNILKYTHQIAKISIDSSDKLFLNLYVKRIIASTHNVNQIFILLNFHHLTIFSMSYTLWSIHFVDNFRKRSDRGEKNS